MKVLVLGGTGVISKAIVDELLINNYEVSIFNRGTKNINFNGEVELIKGDKKDIADFENKMKSKQFDVVIDMISFNNQDALTTVKTFKNKVKQIIVTSSTAAYNKPFKTIPTREDCECLTTDTRFMYGYNKAEMERFLQKEIKNNNQPITIIRPSLTYGIGSQNIGVLRQNYGIIKRIKTGKPLVMFGDGSTPWNFTFAPDLAKGYVGLVNNKEAFGEAYHITSDENHIWEDLYLEIGKIIGIKPKIVHISSDLLLKANSDMFGHLFYEKTYAGIFDNTKIKKVVPNYKSTISLNTGLKSIIEWFETDAFIIDLEKEQLEDRLVALHKKWIDEINGGKNA